MLRTLDLPQPLGSIDFFSEGIGKADVFAPDADFFWRLRPDTERFVVNEACFRGPWPARAKQSGDLRIACLGDSCVFGTEVRYEESWPARLERRLQAAFPHRAVETINAGMPGFSSIQSARVFERLVRPLEPDLTVLYIGAWNDYNEAVKRNDPATAEALDSNAPRLWRLARETVAEGGGARVPLPVFRESVQRMIDGALAVGSRVAVVLPPLPRTTLERFPQALDYRAALRESAAANGVAVLDAPALFEERAVDVGDWIPEIDGHWPMFQDWVHPSPYGYDLLAGALADLVGPWFEDVAATTASVRIDSVERDGRDVLLRGEGFRPSAIDRAYWGDWWLPELEVLDANTLRVGRWTRLPGGEASFQLVGPGGATARSAPFAVPPPRVEVTFRDDGEVPLLEVTGTFEPRTPVQVFLSTELRESPTATRYGTFSLDAERDGRPPGHDEGPFEILRLSLFREAATCDEQGRLSWRTAFDVTRMPEVPEAVHVQALVADANRHDYAALTPVVSIQL